MTNAINRDFDERVSREHFVIRVQEINSDGIWGSHPFNDGLASFFFLPHVVSIHEEVELDPKNPEHAEMIREYEETTGQKVSSDIRQPPAPQKTLDLPVLDESPGPDFGVSDDSQGDTTFVDIASLERLAETSRRIYAAYDNFDFLGK